MLRWLFTIMIGILFLPASIMLYLYDPGAWPMVLLVFGLALFSLHKATRISKNEECPECGRAFARDEMKVVKHPVHFWHIERRITTYRPCKECRHRMDVKKKTVPRYWFESHK